MKWLDRMEGLFYIAFIISILGAIIIQAMR